MKITELYKPKEITKFRDQMKGVEPNKRRSKFRSPVRIILNKYGWKLAGKGYFGSVFIHPDYEYALKVFAEDSGYMKWLKFSKENQDNPYVPKLKGKVIKITDGIYAARIEKLSDNRGKLFRHPVVMAAIKLNQIIQNDYRRGKQKKDVQEDFWEILPQSIWEDGYDIEEILDFFFTHANDIDLHLGNWMYREETGEPVIIDPFATMADLTKYKGKNKVYDKPVNYTIKKHNEHRIKEIDANFKIEKSNYTVMLQETKLSSYMVYINDEMEELTGYSVYFSKQISSAHRKAVILTYVNIIEEIMTKEKPNFLLFYVRNEMPERIDLYEEILRYFSAKKIKKENHGNFTTWVIL